MLKGDVRSWSAGIAVFLVRSRPDDSLERSVQQMPFEPGFRKVRLRNVWIFTSLGARREYKLLVISQALSTSSWLQLPQIEIFPHARVVSY